MHRDAQIMATGGHTTRARHKTRQRMFSRSGMPCVRKQVGFSVATISFEGKRCRDYLKSRRARQGIVSTFALRTGCLPAVVN